MYESKFRQLCLLLLTLNLPLFLCLEGEHIIGGEEAQAGQFNYHVAIEYSELRYQPYICGGAIVDDRHVITAAHCFVEEDGSGFRPQRTRIVAGVSDLEDRRGAVLRGVAKVYVPERYFRGEAATADIAVLQLEAPIGLGDNASEPIGPIRPAANARSYAGHLAVLTGFGTTSVAVYENARGERQEATGRYSPRLRYAPADVLTNEDCSRIKKELVAPSLVCAKMRRRRAPDSEPTGACSGDSGSPLVLGRSTLIGVLVRSPFGCSELEAPAVYTRVSKFRTFIRLAMRDVTSARIRSHRYVSTRRF
ncbi:hypothetical protein TKK_0018754 [Trichogramma kaykai]|uniref:Peptidase S1 domain-containing protein n=1 Tax=Trichogramma kaykai TaxID=54128 RepID=A0ABD2VXJ1_9HYME